MAFPIAGGGEIQERGEHSDRNREGARDPEKPTAAAIATGFAGSMSVNMLIGCPFRPRVVNAARVG